MCFLKDKFHLKDMTDTSSFTIEVVHVKKNYTEDTIFKPTNSGVKHLHLLAENLEKGFCMGRQGPCANIGKWIVDGLRKKL